MTRRNLLGEIEEVIHRQKRKMLKVLVLLSTEYFATSSAMMTSFS